MSRYSTMTDNPLVEAVARAICASNGLDWEAQGHFLTSASGTGEEQDGFRDSATAALRAIEDAGWKVVPVEATPDMENAAYEVQVKGADLHDFEAHDCAKEIWAAMISAAPTPTAVPNNAD